MDNTRATSQQKARVRVRTGRPSPDSAPRRESQRKTRTRAEHEPRFTRHEHPRAGRENGRGRRRKDGRSQRMRNGSTHTTSEAINPRESHRQQDPSGRRTNPRRETLRQSAMRMTKVWRDPLAPECQSRKKCRHVVQIVVAPLFTFRASTQGGVRRDSESSCRARGS